MLTLKQNHWYSLNTFPPYLSCCHTPWSEDVIHKCVGHLVTYAKGKILRVFINEDGHGLKLSTRMVGH